MIEQLVLQLARATGMDPLDIYDIASSAPRRYKTFSVLKKDGVSRREISQPAREVKVLQRAFSDLFLSTLPVHHCATAYRARPGLSLRDNVLPHAANGPILKMDFRNFFPSIKGADWVSFCREREMFASEDDLYLSELLLFRRTAKGRPLSLAIGAPSSPLLSNILLYDLDERLFREVGDRYVTYTRYADDMTFSAPRTGFLQGVQSIVARAVRETKRPNLDLNPDKTRFVTTKFNRNVTGLTISLDGRVTAGQYRKRQIRAGIYRFTRKELDAASAVRLAGLIAFVNSVEPGFIDKLRVKHGEEVVAEITRQAIKRKGCGRITDDENDTVPSS
ncbi:retron St85 family RNA-directed DNA polymerase [Brevundimonas naejangsanensis]|uniref:retron St85 family RNA-directed DNA polymerase n=1 Tax=Brevundimonas naejangsanensis TaxID=588932 RepID=UPI0026F27473|nr:retron St85 family RNA-directed DNA polymerase [Brevundimonas naejangsanensis]